MKSLVSARNSEEDIAAECIEIVMIGQLVNIVDAYPHCLSGNSEE